MAQTAISAQNSKLEISGTTGAAKNITGVQLSNPVVITATAHGLKPGDVVTVAGIVGTTELNGVKAVVEYVTANTVALANVNAAAMTAYTSGGTLTPVQWTKIGGLKSFSGFDGQANEIDTTDLDSPAEEIILGIARYGSFTIELNKKFDDITAAEDPGQLALSAAYTSNSRRSFRLTLPNNKTRTFDAYVRANPLSGAVDAVATASVPLRITGPVVSGG